MSACPSADMMGSRPICATITEPCWIENESKRAVKRSADFPLSHAAFQGICANGRHKAQRCQLSPGQLRSLQLTLDLGGLAQAPDSALSFALLRSASLRPLLWLLERPGLSSAQRLWAALGL